MKVDGQDIFKIGITERDIAKRIAEFGYKIDLTASYVLQFPNRHTAWMVEQALHKKCRQMLAEKGEQQPRGFGSGHTEYFPLTLYQPALREAENYLFQFSDSAVPILLDDSLAEKLQVQQTTPAAARRAERNQQAIQTLYDSLQRDGWHLSAARLSGVDQWGHGFNIAALVVMLDEAAFSTIGPNRLAKLDLSDLRVELPQMSGRYASAPLVQSRTGKQEALYVDIKNFAGVPTHVAGILPLNADLFTKAAAVDPAIANFQDRFNQQLGTAPVDPADLHAACRPMLVPAPSFKKIQAAMEACG